MPCPINSQVICGTSPPLVSITLKVKVDPSSRQVVEGSRTRLDRLGVRLVDRSRRTFARRHYCVMLLAVIVIPPSGILSSEGASNVAYIHPILRLDFAQEFLHGTPKIRSRYSPHPT